MKDAACRLPRARQRACPARRSPIRREVVLDLARISSYQARKTVARAFAVRARHCGNADSGRQQRLSGVVGPAIRHTADRFTGGRIADGDRGATLRIRPSAIDVTLLPEQPTVGQTSQLSEPPLGGTRREPSGAVAVLLQTRWTTGLEAGPAPDLARHPPQSVN